MVFRPGQKWRQQKRHTSYINRSFLSIPPHTFILVVLDRPDKLVDCNAHLVRISGWKVRENLTSVDSLPQEWVVGKFVDQGPTQLLSHESIHLGGAHDLRQLGGITESVCWLKRRRTGGGWWWWRRRWRWLLPMINDDDVTMDGWTDAWMDGMMDGWNDGWIDRWING